MSRIILAAIVGIATAVAIGSCAWSDSGQALKGSGTVATDARAVAGFTKVDLQGVGMLRVGQSTVETLTVRTDDNLLPLITTEVRDGTLVIAIDTGEPPRGIAPTALVYDLSVISLKAISVAGAVQVEGRSLVSGDLRLDIAGAARVDLDGLRATTLRVSSAGGSAFTLTGTVDAQEVVIAGAGDYQARSLASRTATVRITGAGHAAIQVADALNASIDGTGVIECVGNPTVVQHVTGLGTVRQIAA